MHVAPWWAHRGRSHLEDGFIINDLASSPDSQFSTGWSYDALGESAGIGAAGNTESLSYVDATEHGLFRMVTAMMAPCSVRA